MAEPTSRAVAVVKDYAGLQTNSGPAAGDPAGGAADDQVNLMAVRPGELTARPGYRPVEFDTE